MECGQCKDCKFFRIRDIPKQSTDGYCLRMYDSDGKIDDDSLASVSYTYDMSFSPEFGCIQFEPTTQPQPANKEV